MAALVTFVQPSRGRGRPDSSFRGASIASEPGIQKHGNDVVGFWIPGPARSRRPGMTGFEYDEWDDLAIAPSGSI
jgi:hypothetical protein